MGCVLWEVFSNNHSVIAEDRREVDLGSFRGASSTLDAFDRDEAADSDSGDWMDVWDRGDHMRFYCGLAFISGRTDYGPVYEMLNSPGWRLNSTKPTKRPPARRRRRSRRRPSCRLTAMSLMSRSTTDLT